MIRGRSPRPLRRRLRVAALAAVLPAVAHAAGGETVAVDPAATARAIEACARASIGPREPDRRRTRHDAGAARCRVGDTEFDVAVEPPGPGEAGDVLRAVASPL